MSLVTRTYYYAGGQQVAMRVFDGEYAPLCYLHDDHLGSMSLATHGQREPLQWRTYLPLVMSGYDGSGSPPAGDEPPPLTPSGPIYVSPPDAPAPGTVVAGSETRYAPYGEVRTGGEAVAGLTDFTYTGQQVDRDTGLMYYNARFYDPALGRFISADTIVPEPGNPQDLNRYTYVRNNPLLYTDPAGHFINIGAAAIGAAVGGVIGAATSAGPQMIQNIREGQPLTANIDPSQVAKDAAIGAAVGAVGGLTFGAGLAAGGAIAGAIGVSSASGAAATAIGVTTVAASGAAAGQTSRATSNVLYGRGVTEGLFQPKDMLLDAAFSATIFKIGGGNFNQIAPSDITRPGAYARESIASSGSDVTRAESAQIQTLGNRWGCHTCGTRQPSGQYGTWVGDHMPPTSQAGGMPQQLYPQCASCSARQGGYLSHNTTCFVNHIWDGAWRLYYAWGPAWVTWDNQTE
ncbi:MAG: RHS repeat-associated core domain-containing protein [Chloroflexota bacterium]|nr:RHS repeat-associated core domain-containing protein [Chloroflexota bacterium]